MICLCAVCVLYVWGSMCDVYLHICTLDSMYTCRSLHCWMLWTPSLQDNCSQLIRYVQFSLVCIVDTRLSTNSHKREREREVLSFPSSLQDRIFTECVGAVQHLDRIVVSWTYESLTCSSYLLTGCGCGWVSLTCVCACEAPFRPQMQWQVYFAFWEVQDLCDLL